MHERKRKRTHTPRCCLLCSSIELAEWAQREEVQGLWGIETRLILPFIHCDEINHCSQKGLWFIISRGFGIVYMKLHVLHRPMVQFWKWHIVSGVTQHWQAPVLIVFIFYRSLIRPHEDIREDIRVDVSVPSTAKCLYHSAHNGR